MRDMGPILAKIAVLEQDNEMLESTVTEQAKEIERLTVWGRKWKDRCEIIERVEKQLELAVKALENINKTYMTYIENEIECDTAAVIMDRFAETALSSIQSLSGGTNT